MVFFGLNLKEGLLNKVLITTVPFGSGGCESISLLENAGIEYTINPIGRKLNESELYDLVGDFDAIIAGTEQISSRVIEKTQKLKLISRVGVGLDGVDLMAAAKNNVLVSYTPEAPAPAVAELAVGLIFSLARKINQANLAMHDNEWNRFYGKRIEHINFGILGVGRIGIRVIKMLHALGAKKILVNDREQKKIPDLQGLIEWVEKDEIYAHSDLISIHLPLNETTHNIIRYSEMIKMKKGAMIVNTARGGIVNELDLSQILSEGHLSGAAIDVYEIEPYSGPLSNIDNCLLTSHMGSMSYDCRCRMEVEATEEVIRFFQGKDLKGLVPSSEYLEKYRL
jgi:D-3-phosphoglycerate dehydrogenase